jgi:uncharacterized metal-binding protein YceD (DUF177 family)
MSSRHKYFHVSPEQLAAMPDRKAKYEIELDDRTWQDDDLTVHWVKGYVQLELQRGYLLCKAELEASVKLICDRTLEPYDENVAFTFEEAIEVLMHHQDFASEMELVGEEIHEQVRYLEKLDILDLVRQYIIINLPVRRLRPDNCYNEELTRYEKTASTPAVDPRWEVLRQVASSWESAPPSDNNGN